MKKRWEHAPFAWIQNAIYAADGASPAPRAKLLAMFQEATS